MQGIVLGLSSLFHGLHCGLDDKEFACSAEDLGLMPVLGRSPGEGDGNTLQYFCLENPMARRAGKAIVQSAGLYPSIYASATLF